MKRAFPVTAVLVFLFCATLLAQDKPFELADKLNNADRATAMKMFPELEKKNLVGVSHERQLVGCELQTVTKFFFHLPLSGEAKALYYCFKLKTGDPRTRRLAAENLRGYPKLIAATLDELAEEENAANFDSTVLTLLAFAAIELHRDSPLSFALYWDYEDKTAFCKLLGNQLALTVTAELARQDSRGASSDVRAGFNRSLLRFSSFGAIEDFADVLKKRVSSAGDETVKSDFKLALAFAQGNLDKLFATVLDTGANMHLRKFALNYIEASDKPEVIDKLQAALGNLEGEMLDLTLSALRKAAEKHRSIEKNCDMALSLLKDSKTKKQVRLWSFEYLRDRADWKATERLISIADTLKTDGLLENTLDTLSRLARRLKPKQKADVALNLYEKLGEDHVDWIRSFLLEHAERKLAQRLFDRARKVKNETKRQLYESWTRAVTEKYWENEKISESYVTAKLRYLHFHQDRDGKWDADGFQKNCDTRFGRECGGKGAADYDVVVSGLSLLTFLEEGDTHQTGQFRKTMHRGFKWLWKQQTETGYIGLAGKDIFIEGHAIATKAFCQTYEMTKDKTLKSWAEKALQFLLDRQCKDGGWKKSEKSDSSNALTTAWTLLALKDAKAGGLNVPDNVFEKALNFLDSLTLKQRDERAGFVQLSPLQAVAATATAYILCGRPKNDKKFLRMIETLDKHRPKWAYDAGPVYWYFGTYAMQHHGGEKWDKWCEAVKKVLRDRQRIGGCADGSWDPVGPDAKKLGRLGVTGLNSLSLWIWYKSEKAKSQDK